MYPILIVFMEGTYILKNYYNNTTITNINLNPLLILKNRYYRIFRKLRKNKFYFINILFPILSLVIYYIIFLYLLNMIKNRKRNDFQLKTSFEIYFKIFLLIYMIIFFLEQP